MLLWNAELILLIVTVPFELMVSPVVLTPEPLTTKPPASAILITTPDAGCVSGKDSSSAITSSPPIGAICAAT